MLKYFFLLTVFVSVAELCIFYESTLNKTNKNFFMLYITTLTSNYGYAMSIFSTNYEGAICGNMISYIGSIFTLFFLVLAIFEMCKTKFNIIYRISLILISIVIIILISTTQHTHLFYSNVHITYYNGMAIIDHLYGKLHWIYTFYLIVLNTTAFYVVIRAIVKEKKISKKTSCMLLLVLVLGTVVYLIQQIAKTQLNYMPIVYCVVSGIFLKFFIHADMYDLTSNLINVYKKRGNYGYISFDIDKNYLGCDEFALTVFPELDLIPIDSKISAFYKNLRNKLHYEQNDWNWDDKMDTDFYIKSSGYTVICTIHYITYRNRNIGYLLEIRDETDLQNYISDITHDNKALEIAVNKKTRRIAAIQDSIIKSMAIMVERRDNSTGNHILRTSDCVRIFMEKLRQHPEFEWCTEEFSSRVIKAAPLHDLGKISIDDAILRKPGRFSEEEYNIMKKHAKAGSLLVREVLKPTTDNDFKRIAANIAHFHHEKWDGTGYPENYSENLIPLEARIMALADVFDALVSQRCYKEAIPLDDAFKIIKNDLGKHFDPVIGKVFLECRPELEAYYLQAFKIEALKQNR